jgi:hypothetical protein
MLLSGRPLLGSQRDGDLFVGRGAELTQLRRAAAAGLNAVVVGERGVGATSLVYALLRDLDNGGAATVAVARCGGARSVEDVLAGVVLALTGAAPTATGALASTMGLLVQLAQAVQHGDADTTVLVVDDLPVELGGQLLAEYRDDLWAVGASWVVTVADEDRARLLALPGGAFFELQLELGELDEEHATALLARRLPDTDAARLAKLVAAAGGGHPRRLLDVARAVISMGSGEVGPAFTAHTAALRELGAPAHMLFTELMAAGAASASDARLQERMGWTRVRVQQVLTQLEGAGLTRATTSRLAGGQGRPRKVFHPVPVVDWYAEQAGIPA